MMTLDTKQAILYCKHNFYVHCETKKKYSCDCLYSNICFIAVVWSRILNISYICLHIDFSGGSDCKESAHNAGHSGSTPGSGSFLERGWLPTPVFLPGEFHGQRILMGWRPWGCKESDTTEWLTLSLSIGLCILHLILLWI